jgi:FkbM family methyltransferase
MKNLVKSVIRNLARKSGHIVLDLRKDQPTFHFLPGHLRKVLQEQQINCVIDVGANVGRYGQMIRDLGYNGRLISIEPSPDNYTALANLAANDPEWLTFNFALGETCTERTLNLFAAGDLNSFLAPASTMSENIINSQITGSTTVTIQTLDSVLAELTAGIANPRIFLKLDTQGYDLKVIEGAQQALSSIGALQSELSSIHIYDGMPDYLEALAHYRKLGFQPTAIFPVEFERITGHVLEFDVVLTRSAFPSNLRVF